MIKRNEERKKSKKRKRKEIDEIPPFKEIMEKIKESDEIPTRKATTETHSSSDGSRVLELSLQDLKDEYKSVPSQICVWFWCIEYVAKFKKDLRCILDFMNMGYPDSKDYGKRINEILSLRILESLFDYPKCKNVVDDNTLRIEFDLSTSNVEVLNTILKEIPISELRRGLPELSEFNVLPFITHKNKNLPQCALEKMNELGFLENQATMKANDSFIRNVQSSQHAKKPVNEVIIIDDSDDDEDEDEDKANTKNDEITGETPPIVDACITNSKDIVWLISDDDDEEEEYDHMVKTNAENVSSSSRTRVEKIECWKCRKEKGTLLICNGNECEAKVHKECMNFPVDFDEDGNYFCAHCLLIRITREYEKSLENFNGVFLG